MKITKLSWAGLLLETKNTRLYIDPLRNMAETASQWGMPKFPIHAMSILAREKNHTLITHSHHDHLDFCCLTRLLAGSGELWAPPPVCVIARERGLKASVAKIYEPIDIGDFTIVPVPAIEQVGDGQLSYVISDGKNTVFHGGDTSESGCWWNIAEKYGPFHAAFLPLNVVTGLPPDEIPRGTTSGAGFPVNTLAATRILGAKMLVPMQCAQLEDTSPLYSYYPDTESILEHAASQQHIAIHRLKNGQVLHIG